MEILLKFTLKKNVCEHVGKIFSDSFHAFFFPERHSQKDTQPFAYYYLSDTLFTRQKL